MDAVSPDHADELFDIVTSDAVGGTAVLPELRSAEEVALLTAMIELVLDKRAEDVVGRGVGIRRIESQQEMWDRAEPLDELLVVPSLGPAVALSSRNFSLADNAKHLTTQRNRAPENTDAGELKVGVLAVEKGRVFVQETRADPSFHIGRRHAGAVDRQAIKIKQLARWPRALQDAYSGATSVKSTKNACPVKNVSAIAFEWITMTIAASGWPAPKMRLSA